jgi:hypothetical protein
MQALHRPQPQLFISTCRPIISNYHLLRGDVTSNDALYMFLHHVVASHFTVSCLRQTMQGGSQADRAGRQVGERSTSASKMSRRALAQ